VLPAVGFPHLAPAGYRRVPAQDNGGRLQENAPAVGQRRDAQVITESGAVPMKHPARSDFDTAVTEAGVNVTFKPTNSTYSFYRLAESEDIARLGPVSLERVRHAGPSGDTEDYPSVEVQDMAQPIASEVGASVWSVQDEKEADELTLRGHPISGDDDVIE
jgi:hypothetical protein